MLDTSPLQPGETIASVARIRDVADLPEMPVLVPQWTEDGKDCKIVLRALSFAERRRVREKAKGDPDTEVLYVCLYGIKEPRLDENQLDILEKKHPGAIDAIAETITKLGEFDAATVLAHVRSLAGLGSETSGDTAPAD